jgi:N-acetylglucosamine kinase-like BadF-type ATPase
LICIIDSGSSKSDWAIIGPKGDLFQSFTTAGMNPIVGFNKDKISTRVNSLISEADMQTIEHIYFFGSGVVDSPRVKTIKTFLKKCFSRHIDAQVSSDLAGASIACFGENNGYIGIVGTGSSAAYFNGKKITKKAKALGYLISDDGGGFHIGRKILRAYYHQQMSELVNQRFEDFFNRDSQNIYDKIYKSQKPNAAIASYARFLNEISADPFVTEILTDTFNSYFENIVSQLDGVSKKKKISFVGSVAYHYSQHLKEAATRYGFQTELIIERPIHRLVLHYRQNLLNSE